MATINRACETDVLTNENGDIEILQKGEDDEDQLVWFPAIYAEVICKAIMDAKAVILGGGARDGK